MKFSFVTTILHFIALTTDDMQNYIVILIHFLENIKVLEMSYIHNSTKNEV